ncbi:hypothetical protein PHYPSEUDO_012603 [Phytophthora pseudosyringae]|uniref:Uncharacterized protein n=1 Tax=Phytophthora pseudosyringae TaxID=221518 RepID=A0A8T1W4S5_9STRA|nr:hypothetical protein PHYPSEUDO_012603 [Phytophthora pseudosyringae]
MERSSRRDRSRDPEDDPSSDTGAGTRLRSRRMRGMRGSAADSTSDGADTDASSAGRSEDAPQCRQRRRSSARKAAEETRKSARELRSADERHSPRSGDDEDEDGDNADDTGGRTRSLSNVSITSSTSASSMASEPLTEEQRRVRLDQQVAELEQKKKMVEDGTLAEFCRRVAAFKEERNRLLQTAELHKNLQLKNGQDLYRFDVQRAHHLWENDRKVLQEELLAKVDVVMAKLQVEMKALSEPGAKTADIDKKLEQNPQAGEADRPSVSVAVMKQKTGESKNSNEPEQEEGEVPEPPAARSGVPLLKRRKMDPTVNADPVEVSKLLPVEAVRLPFDDVSSDIAAIVGDRKETAQATVEQLPNNGNLPFKLERRRLFCGKHVFEDGDEVHVSMPLVHENYTGTISSITDDAIYIKLASGEKARIFLPHLERRRCELKPLLRGTPSTGSLQIMGWSEYDTFY